MMLEVWTLPVAREALTRILGNLKKMAGAKPVAPSGSVPMTFSWRSLPSLTAFTVDRVMPQIGLSHRGAISVSEVVSLCADLSPKADSCVARFDMAHAGAPYDVAEETDVVLVFGFDWIAPFVEIQTGELSLGAEDLAARARIFQPMIGCSGFSDLLSLSIRDGFLSVETDCVVAVSSMPREKVLSLMTEGRRFYKTNCGDIKGRNFRDLRLYLTGRAEMARAAESVLRELGGESNVGGYDTTVSCTQDTYDWTRGILNARKSLAGWHVDFMARQKYSLESLDVALRECSSILLPVYTIKQRGIGEVSVALYHADGKVLLCFESDRVEDKVEKAIHRIVSDLAEGSDIIDRSPR